MLEQNKHGIWTPRNVCASGFFQFGDFGFQQAAAAAAGGGGSSYHPDDDGAGADMYILANADDITEAGTGVDRWNWRNTAGVLAGHNFKQGTDASRPSYNTTGVLSKPCVTFNGTSDRMLGRNNANSADLPMSTFLDTNAVGCILVVFATGAVASTSSTPYNNDTILGDDSGGTGGIVLHNNTTDYDFRCWSWTGATPFADAKFSLSSGVVGMYRKTGTTLYSSVNGGSESSAAAATVSTLTYGVQIGDALGEEFNGELYCIMAWKSTPANIADIITNLMTYYGIS